MRIFLLPAICAASMLTLSAAGPVRVLILSGQNNHKWQETTPALQGALESDGRFKVTVCETPWMLTPAQLEKVDVIVSNWNAFTNPAKGVAPKVAEWSEASRSAYIEFVRKGGGHVVVHAGSASFPDWEDYQEICLATWKLGATGHDAKHEFEVRIEEPSHPITAGLSGFKTLDELWIAPKVTPGAKVLVSSFSEKGRLGTDTWEPSVLVGEFGKGRCFTILLGHAAGKDGQFMSNPQFIELFRRGVEWAAIGTVSRNASPDAGHPANSGAK